MYQKMVEKNMWSHLGLVSHLVFGLGGRLCSCVLKLGVWESFAERCFGEILRVLVHGVIVFVRVLVKGDVRGVMVFVCEVKWWCVGPGTSDVCRWEL